MNLELNFYNFIYVFSCFLGYLLGFVLLTYGIKKRTTNILMGLSFLFLSHGILLAGLIDTGLIIHFPLIYRTGNLSGLIYAFLPFLYIQFTLFKTRFKWWNLVHLLPALIYTVDYWPVLMMNSSEKLDLILSEVNDPYLIVSFTQSRFFPSGFYTPFRTILINFYWVLSLILVWKFKKMNPDLGEKKDVYHWIRTYLFFQLVMFLPFYFTLGSLDKDVLFKAVHFGAALQDLSTGLFLLYFPNILYGFDFSGERQSLEKPASDGAKNQLKTPIIDEEKAAELDQILKMKLEEKVFLIRGYSINDLAKDSGIPHYLLSQYINHHLGISFPDFINRERILYCCQLLDSDQAVNYTLEAIGELSGFSNRNSFSASFKKVMGKSPSKYLKEKSEKNSNTTF